MPQTQEDYWPPDIEEGSFESPVAIMRAQATLLGEKTKQQMTAQVQLVSGPGQLFIWSFQLSSPALGSYRYELFRVSSPVTLFPATFHWEGHANKVVENKEEFKQTLREILGSDQTKKIIQGLLAQIIR